MPRVRRLSPIAHRWRLSLAAAAFLAALLVGGLALLAIPADAQEPEPEGVRQHGLFRLVPNPNDDALPSTSVFELPPGITEFTDDEATVRSSGLLREPGFIPNGLGDARWTSTFRGDFFFSANVSYHGPGERGVRLLGTSTTRILSIPTYLVFSGQGSSQWAPWTIGGREAVVRRTEFMGFLVQALVRVIDGPELIQAGGDLITLEEAVAVAVSMLGDAPLGSADLRPGLNSVSYLGTGQPIRQALGTAADDVTAVWRLSLPVDGRARWEAWRPDLPDFLQDFNTFEYAQPYLVASDATRTWRFPDGPVSDMPAAVELRVGSNHLVYLGGQVPIAEALGSAPVTAIWRFDPKNATQPWSLWAPGPLAALADFDTFEYGASYFLIAAESSHWSFPAVTIR